MFLQPAPVFHIGLLDMGGQPFGEELGELGAHRNVTFCVKFDVVADFARQAAMENAVLKKAGILEPFERRFLGFKVLFGVSEERLQQVADNLSRVWPFIMAS